ncbi:ribbon-helix-helix domain-containing protein [Blastopirellula retiformator]|uniref:ribbon-helix-helix domain-containing protein n=1 Tax=Blastopirellula retiformator TaxID=2527970 RepID=UPI0011B7D31C|nr:CopG family transcriptional regulator [Blastopirellula retiformator]
MNIDLSAEDAASIQRLVATGEFKSPPEAVAAGIQLLLSRQQLRTDIQIGIDELDAGNGIDGDRVFAELREHSRRSSDQAN